MSDTPKKLPTAIYDPSSVQSAYCLRFAWTGWFSGEVGAELIALAIDELRPTWDAEGIRVLEQRLTVKSIQLLVSTTPRVAPQFVAARLKGRIDHALRAAGMPIKFRKKHAVRSLGENVRHDVESYIERQVGAERFLSDSFAEKMRQYTFCFPDVDLSHPIQTKHGAYWYNLHLVLVAEGRYRNAPLHVFDAICDGCLRIAKKKGFAISRLSVMPEHLHMALRGDIETNPACIAGAFQNNLAFMLGQIHYWQDSYYVGTFGEYNMNAIRLALNLIHPAGERQGVRTGSRPTRPPGACHLGE